MPTYVENQFPIILPPDGKLRLAFVGEAPADEEIKSGRPFTAASYGWNAGSELDLWLRSVGILRPHCFIGNLSMEQAPGNNIEKMFLDSKCTMPNPALTGYIETLKSQLEELRPHCIVALGNHPSYILTGKTGLFSKNGFWAGSILPCTLIPGLKVIPIAHPAFIIRGLFALRQMMGVFLRRAIEESNYPELKPPEYELVLDPDPDTIFHHLDRLRNSPKIAFDIENPGRSPIVCISFSDSIDWAISIPFNRGTGHRWHRYVEQEIWVKISKLLSGDALKIAHNLNYDFTWLTTHKVHVKPPYWDTMQSHHACYPDMSREELKKMKLNSLAACTALYTREPYYKCLKGSTEVLTPQGWIGLDELNTSNSIMTYDKGSLKWDNITSYYSYNFSGYGIRVRNDRHNTWYTPNHKVVAVRGLTSSHYDDLIPISDCPKLTAFKVAGNYLGGPLNNNHIKLIVAVQADAHIDKYQHVIFKFKKDRKVVRLREILDELEIDYTENGPTLCDERITIRIKRDNIKHIIEVLGPNKQYGSWLLNYDKQTLRSFIQEVQYWDGWKTINGHALNYSSQYINNVLWVATIGHLCGYSCKIKNYAGYYQVSLKNDTYISVRQNRHITSEFFDGPVFCISVPSKAFLARSNGQIFITGNSDFKVDNDAGPKYKGSEYEFWKYNAKDSIVLPKIQEATERDLEKMGQLSCFQHDMSVWKPLMAMSLKGIKVNQQLKKEVSDLAENYLIEIQEQITQLAGREVLVTSPVDVKKLLYSDLGLPIQYDRKTKRISSDAVALHKLAKKTGHKIPMLIVDHRRFSKFKSTYADVQLHTDGRFHCTYNQARTTTFRLSSSEFCLGSGANLQNIPTRKRNEERYDNLISNYKKTFLPDTGMLFGKRDLKQAEALVVAYLARDVRQIEDFANEIDTHSIAASFISGIDYKSIYEGNQNNDPKYKMWRRFGKTVRHATNYRMGKRTLRDNFFKEGFDIPEKECGRMISAMLSGIPMVVNWQMEVEHTVKEKRILTTPLGRRRYFMGKLTDDTIREAIAFVPQCTVAHILDIGLDRCYMWLEQQDDPNVFDLLMNIHDAIIWQSSEELIHQHAELIEHLMEVSLTIHNRTLIIPSDLAIGPNWDGLKEIK